MKSIEKNIDRFSSRKGRKIVVDGVQWKYAVPRFGSILAYSERGDRLCDYDNVVAHLDPDVFDRGKWKRTYDGTITPKMIAQWIREKNENKSSKSN